MNSKIPKVIEAQINKTLQILELHLGENLRGIYLFGSAVDGELMPLSDIDIMVTVQHGLKKSTRVALMRQLLTVSAYPGTDTMLRALEVTVLSLDDIVPWRYPARRQMQFGEWLRDDIIDGKVEIPMLDNDLAIMVTKVRQCSTALKGPDAEHHFEVIPFEDVRRALLDTIAQWNSEEDWIGDERNIVLALTRIWYTASTKSIASKDAAANWALERLPYELQFIVRAARDAYLGIDAQAVKDFPFERAELLSFIRSRVLELLETA